MWLRMMIEHHHGAVTMAQQVLATTADSEVKDLANAVLMTPCRECRADEASLAVVTRDSTPTTTGHGAAVAMTSRKH